MKRGQITLFKKLYESDDEFVSKAELASIRDVDSINTEPEKSLVRVFGPLGNRVNSTPNVSGSPGYRAFIETRDSGDSSEYRLRPEARKAIENDDDLMEKIQNPMSELKEDGTKLVR